MGGRAGVYVDFFLFDLLQSLFLVHSKQSYIFDLEKLSMHSQTGEPMQSGSGLTVNIEGLGSACGEYATKERSELTYSVELCSGPCF